MKGKSSVLMLNLLENKIVFLTSFNEIMSFEKSHPEIDFAPGVGSLLNADILIDAKSKEFVGLSYPIHTLEEQEYIVENYPIEKSVFLNYISSDKASTYARYSWYEEYAMSQSRRYYMSFLEVVWGQSRDIELVNEQCVHGNFYRQAKIDKIAWFQFYKLLEFINPDTESIPTKFVASIQTLDGVTLDGIVADTITSQKIHYRTKYRKEQTEAKTGTFL